MSKLLKLIWLDSTDTLWRNRNEVAHGGDSRTRQLEGETWASKLWWYMESRHVISPLDQFVLSFTEEGIESMPSATRRQLVQNLTRLERVFTIEQRARAMGQGTLRSFFGLRQGRGYQQQSRGTQWIQNRGIQIPQRHQFGADGNVSSL